MNKDEIDAILNQIARTKRLSGTLYENHIEHVCSPKYCDPCSEDILVKRGLLDKKKPNQIVYLCNYKVVHVCTIDTCNTTDHGICRISGACYGASGVSSYDKTDYRTWRTKTRDYNGLRGPVRIYGEESKIPKEEEPVFKKPRREYRLSTKDLKKTISGIVKKLLYDSCRKKVNTKRSKKITSLYDDKLDNYKNQCITNKEPINLINIMLFKLEYENNDIEMLPIEAYNIDKIAHYVHLCQQVCIYVQKYWNTKISFECLTIAILYAMKRGYKLHDIEILPMDMYLTHMLPMVNELPFFRISKKTLIKGQNLLERAFLDDIDNGTYNFKLHMIEKEVNDSVYVSMRPANYRKLKLKE